MVNPNQEFTVEILRNYFKKLSILATQIPFEVRGLLLSQYMLYNGFKGLLHFDATGKIGFEIYREASRISIKPRATKKSVEEEVFGVFGDENMVFLTGHDSEIRGGIFTCRDFAEQYGNQLPRNGSVLRFDKTGSIGPFQIGDEAEVKFTDIGIYWLLKKKRLVKHVPFAWVFGEKTDFTKIDPILHAESHFYSSLFGNLYEIASNGYKKPVDKNIQSKVLETFGLLIGKIYTEFKEKLKTTKNDEQFFQQLLVRYKFFLSPGASSIEAQPILNSTVLRKPDFCIKRHDGKIIYVEIEPPFYQPFEGLKPSRRLHGAMKQIADWKKILSRSGNSVNLSYLIIIGLLDDMDTAEKGCLETLNRAQKDLTIVTWDWLLQNINEAKEFIKEKLHGT